MASSPAAKNTEFAFHPDWSRRGATAHLCRATTHPWVAGQGKSASGAFFVKKQLLSLNWD